jgi:ElaB/YqjD/DUF883 family membrane-anchored ribosome-binding protein
MTSEMPPEPPRDPAGAAPDAPDAPDGSSAGASASQAGRTGLLDRFEEWLPEIQRRWPDVARHTLEASRGSLDELAGAIAGQTGRTATVVKQQLLELMDVAGEQTGRLADQLEPLEAQLERLLDELNATLRPRLEKPVRERPLLAIGIAAGVGVLLGLLLAGRRRP